MFNSYVMKFVLYVHLSLTADLQRSQNVRPVPGADIRMIIYISKSIEVVLMVSLTWNMKHPSFLLTMDE